jgi:hypothetical protein
LRADGFRGHAAAVELSDPEAVAALLGAEGVAPEEIKRTARAHRVGAASAELAGRGVVLPPPLGDPLRDLGPRAARIPPAAALRLARLRDGVAGPIAAEFPEVSVRFDLGRLEGLGYYAGPTLRIRLDGPAGPLPVIDGGFTTWTQVLLADRKERLLASGMGTELLCKIYR